MYPFCVKIASGYQPTLDEIISEIGELFPLLFDLSKTPQDPEWHGEGDVHIHTQMVLTNLYTLMEEEGAYLTPEQKLILVLATALHDIAKPVTTRKFEIKGIMRTVAPHHEYKGGSYIAFKLSELGLPYPVIHQIINLVIYHVVPKLLVVKNEPIALYRRLARSVNLELLYYLAKSDIAGRICPDHDKQLELIELYKMFSQEYGLWPPNKPYAAWEQLIEKELATFDDKSKRFVISSAIKNAEDGLIFTADEEIARSFSYRDKFSELIILCGPSGMGKSTWIANNLPDYELISLDLLREEIAGDRGDQSKNGEVLQAAKKLLKTHLAKKKNVVWDATNLRKDFRTQIADIGFSYKAFVTTILFYKPISIFKSQNKNRLNQVGDKVLEKQILSFEWPELIESHIFKVIGEAGQQLYES